MPESITTLTLRRRGIAIVGCGVLLLLLGIPGVAGDAVIFALAGALIAGGISAAAYGRAAASTGLSTAVLVVTWFVAVIGGMSSGGSFGAGLVVTLGAVLTAVGNNQLAHGLKR